jgi:hypothetical protein
MEKDEVAKGLKLAYLLTFYFLLEKTHFNDSEMKHKILSFLIAILAAKNCLQKSKTYYCAHNHPSPFKSCLNF